VEFCLDWFFVRDFKNGHSIVVGEFLDPKDGLYNFCDSTRPKYETNYYNFSY
jgi:hypothetical protein